MSGPPPPPTGGMSLYANLLDTGSDSSAAASISRAPVLFRQSDDKDDASKKPIDPALRFQPIIRRPQGKQVKPKASFPKAPAAAASTVAAALLPSAPASGTTPQARSKLADWAPTEEDEYMYGSAAGQKRERGGRRSKKKKKFDEQRPAETDWDEIYDPARPTNIEEYLRSDEKIREVQDWKAVLYAHRRKQRRPSSDTDMGSDEEDVRPSMSNQFAPPPSYTFAPPPPPPPPPSSEPSAAPVAETAEEAYARRMALSNQAAHPPPPPPPPPVSDSTISRAPVRYSPPPPPPPADPEADVDVDMSDIPDLLAPPPSKSGFAARIMSKYGWTKGSGLGAEGAGITTALRVQVEKRRRRADADGGGFAEPGGRGKIIAPRELGKRRQDNNGGEQQDEEEEGGGQGKMSQVVVLRGMLEGMDDLRAEVEDGLGQEIGEECGEKYGRVERVYVDVEGGRRVYIKFTDAVSALRAVNALEGRVFNGNVIRPAFYDAERFERGEYEVGP